MVSATVDGWFAVSREGLAQLMDGRARSFIVRELVQNAWDEPGVKQCDVRVTLENEGYALIEVSDDAPEGFADLTHAFTLFAKTRKRANPERRGRFNLGEKQVLSICYEASISTTTGTVVFECGGQRRQEEKRTLAGSVFRGLVKMTLEDVQGCVAALRSFIVPKGIRTTINGEVILPRKPVAKREASLVTEYEHEDGSWRRTKRNTVIRVHEVRPGEKASLYEMGIPVVELEAGDCYHYDVDQRVPLNQDRDNVSPAYLRDLRAEVLNVVADQLTAEQAAESWAREATDSDRVSKKAFTTVLEKRYGDKVASFSPGDPESNNAAVAEGYNVISGGSMSSGEWANARRFGAVPAASQVCPTRHPQFSPDGVDTEVPEAEWTAGMREVAAFINRISDRIAVSGGVNVRIVRDRWNRFGGWYGGRTITINLQCVGHKFFNGFPDNMAQVVDFMIHELGHEFSPNHLDEAYYKALTRMAGKVAALALEEPELFRLKGK